MIVAAALVSISMRVFTPFNSISTRYGSSVILQSHGTHVVFFHVLLFGLGSFHVMSVSWLLAVLLIPFLFSTAFAGFVPFFVTAKTLLIFISALFSFVKLASSTITFLG